MNFDIGDKAKEVRDQVAAFMEAHVYPNEEEMFAQIDEGDRWQPIPLLEELKAKARAEGLWNLFLPESDLRRRALQPRLRARLRGDGALPLRARGLQLLGAGYRQHGGAGPLWHRGAAGGSGSCPCSPARSAPPSP